MYERSAIVLERYMEKILEFNKQNNLKNNYSNYKGLIDEVENYQVITTNENKIIQEFDETVKKIEGIQKEQEKLYKADLKLEEDRNKLFYDLGEDVSSLESKFQKIETNLDKNNEQFKKLRSEFIKYLSDFTQRQKERNKCEKARRLGEKSHLEYVEKVINEFKEIDVKDLAKLKKFADLDKDGYKQELNEIMVKNGKNERVPFNQEVLKIAIETRIDIAEREAECYATIYDKMKRLLGEIDSDNLKLAKYKKILKDVSVKLAFLNAEKEYIVSFLDYERMTAISGVRAHKKMMEDACKNFELDIAQINNLYELILREISNKSTKKAYRELYNKTYLKNIEDKEKNFQEEVNSIKINMGTVINSNYWRIEGIKNVYEVFQNEVSEKYNKDLSEFRIDDGVKEEKEEKNKEESKEKIKTKTSKKEKEKDIKVSKKSKKDEEKSNNSISDKVEEIAFDKDDNEFGDYDKLINDDEDIKLDEEFFDEEDYDEDEEFFDDEEEDYDEDEEFFDDDEEDYDEDEEFFDDEYEDDELDTKGNNKKLKKTSNGKISKKAKKTTKKEATSKINNKSENRILGKIFKDRKTKSK